MASIIAAITSFGGTALAFAIKIFGSMSTVVGGWFSSIGWKLLSFQWIKSVYDFIVNAFGILKKTVFNPKVVKIARVIVSLALFVLTAVQIYFLVKVFVAFYPYEGEFIPILALNGVAIVFCVGYCLAFLFGLIKKKMRYGFIATIVATYFIVLFSSNLLVVKFYSDLYRAFDALKIPFIAVFSALAILKLIDAEKRTSIFAFFLSALGVFVAYKLFNDENFAYILKFEYVSGEVTFSSNGIRLFPMFRELIAFFSGQNSGLYDMGAQLVRESISYSVNHGVWIAGIILVVNFSVIIICEILPYVIISVGIGLMMSMLNNRTMQSAYLTKTIRLLKYAFWGAFVALILAFIGMFVVNGKGALILTMNVGGIILTFAAIIGLLIICYISRKLIADKYYNEFKKYLGK